MLYGAVQASALLYAGVILGLLLVFLVWHFFTMQVLFLTLPTRAALQNGVLLVFGHVWRSLPAGLLLAGFLADIRKRAFMPVITLCVLMLSNMAIFFLSDPRHYQLNLSILYFYSGFYVVYFTVLFLDLAPGTRWPLLWAGMGRLCRSLCVGAFFLCPSDLFGLLGQEYSIVLNTLLLAGVCAIFFWSGQLRDHGAARSAPPLRQAQAIGLFAQKHALTHRETDVLRAVLASSDPLGNIAVCLGISERVMQRHLTSIYAKCGVSGRLELVTAFFGQTPP